MWNITTIFVDSWVRNFLTKFLTLNATASQVGNKYVPYNVDNAVTLMIVVVM